VRAVLEEPVILIRAPSKGRVLITVSSWIYPSTEPLDKGANKQPFSSRREKDSKNNKKMTGDGPLSFFIFLKFLINNNNDKSLLISCLVNQFTG
jgi:hypothetical protein